MASTAVRVTLNSANIRGTLKSPAVRSDLLRRAEAVAAAAGPGHRVVSEVGSNRARAAVITATASAMRREATARNLTKAIQAAR